MIFEEQEIEGLYVIKHERISDIRGYFSRSFCVNEYSKNDLDPTIVQCNTSYNKNKGTLRGLHFQHRPHQEVKIVRCIQGKIFDVVIDLRVESPTYGNWKSFELSSDNENMLYIPKGFAHGFQTLVNNSIVYYQVSEFYNPDYEDGIKWDDSYFDIAWPINNPILSDKDDSWPRFKG